MMQTAETRNFRKCRQHRLSVPILLHCASNLLCNEFCGRLTALQFNRSPIRIGAGNFSVRKQNEVDREGYFCEIL